MDLANLDLNLLCSLHALLQEGSVTRAAARLNVGQPAMSTRLARLRRHFSDRLLTREGQAHGLTPLATHLLPRTEVAISSVRKVFAEQHDFDPLTADLELRIAMSDYALTVLGGPLSTLLESEAPHIRVQIELFNDKTMRELSEAHRLVDAIVVPHGILPRLPHVDLYRDEWVCIAGADNPAIGGQPSIDDLAAMPWVLCYDTSPTMQSLKLRGIEPRRRILVDSLTAAPELVAGTSRVAVVPARVAQRSVDSGAPLRIIPCPLGLPPLREALWWHPIHHDSAGHRWFRRALAEAARKTEAETAPRPLSMTPSSSEAPARRPTTTVEHRDHVLRT